MKFAYYLPVIVKWVGAEELPPNTGGTADYNIIFGVARILRSEKYTALGEKYLKHELHHLKIYARLPIINWLWAKLSKKKRAQFEEECRKEVVI